MFKSFRIGLLILFLGSPLFSWEIDRNMTHEEYTTTQKLVDAQHEVKNIQAALEEKECQTNDQQELITYINTYLSELDTFLDELETSHLKVCDQIDAHTCNHENHKKEIETLHAMISKLECFVSDLEKKHSSSIAQIKSQQSTTNPCQEIEDLRSQLCMLKCEDLEAMKAHICQLQNQIDCIEHEVFTSSPSHMFYGSPGTYTWRAGAEFLYWTIYESELDFVVDGGPTSFGSLPSTGAVGQLRSAEYDWKPGLRVYLDYQFCHDYWNLRGQYTYFYCSGSNSASKPGDELLNGTFHQTVGPVGLATSDIEFHYHLVDLLLSRSFILSPHLLSRLQFGGIGAWIKQDWEVVYIEQVGANTEVIDVDWKFNGGGFKFGMALDWDLFCGWSLLAQANWGGLIGWYCNQLKEETFQNGAFFDLSADSRNDHARFVQTFQITLGPSWTFCCRCFQGRLYALYEMNGWLGLQQVDRSFIGGITTDGRDSRHVEGIIGMHGLTLGIDFLF